MSSKNNCMIPVLVTSLTVLVLGLSDLDCLKMNGQVCPCYIRISLIAFLVGCLAVYAQN